MKTFVLLVLVLGSLAAPRAERAGRNGVVETYWPNGTMRSSAMYLDDVFHGEYRTWRIDGRPYELKHFIRGREAGLQQAWDDAGTLYLNYEVRDGRRYGMANAKPCIPNS